MYCMQQCCTVFQCTCSIPLNGKSSVYLIEEPDSMVGIFSSLLSGFSITTSSFSCVACLSGYILSWAVDLGACPRVEISSGWSGSWMRGRLVETLVKSEPYIISWAVEPGLFPRVVTLYVDEKSYIHYVEQEKYNVHVWVCVYMYIQCTLYEALTHPNY